MSEFMIRVGSRVVLNYNGLEGDRDAQDCKQGGHGAYERGTMRMDAGAGSEKGVTSYYP